MVGHPYIDDSRSDIDYSAYETNEESYPSVPHNQLEAANEPECYTDVVCYSLILCSSTLGFLAILSAKTQDTSRHVR